MTRTVSQNPYTVVFGREPGQMIKRADSAESVIDTFSADIPSQQIFMITGVRGSGKTVFMSSVSEHFQEEEGWICVVLGTETDMLTSLAAKLSSQDFLARLFQSARINLSLFGFGLQVSGAVPIADAETAIEKMLETMKQHGRKLLVCIDEVRPTEHLKIFCSACEASHV